MLMGTDSYCPLFFFQAEDGIRDWSVTGVQTCALPISIRRLPIRTASSACPSALLISGAHKINNALGQALLAVRMGKRRIVAETGAGQHGDRKGVGEGKRGDLGGRRIIKKKKKQT